MKRILLYICIICFISSCTNYEYDGIKLPNNDNIIRLTSLRHKVGTRQANENGHPYKVFGIIEGDTEWYMITDVHADDSIKDNSIFYWPGRDSVTFYSFAPHFDGEMVSQDFSSNPPSLVITYKPAGDGNDFTIATPTKQARIPGGDNPRVPLVFKHMLSAITITIKISDELATAGYSLNKNLDEVPEDSSAYGYTVIFKVPYNQGTINAALADPVWYDVEQEEVSFDNNITFYIIPQTYNQTATDTCTIQFDNIWLFRNGVTVFNNLLMKYNLQDGDLTDNTFKPGYKYNSNLTFTKDSHEAGGDPILGEEIIFGSTEEAWDNQSTVNINTN